MKIFGLFGKKNAPQIKNNPSQSTFPSQQAQDTSKKIDAIESEMSAEFRKNISAGVSSVFLEEATIPTADSFPQLIEESAILFASGQTTAAKELLEHLIKKTANTPLQEQLVWWMLFDLLQTECMPAAFEKLALEYANHFETSPPQWLDHQPQITSHGNAPYKLTFSGKLIAESLPQLENLRKAGYEHKRVCLHFEAITEIDTISCTELLDVILSWQAHGCELTLSGAESLADQIRDLTLHTNAEHTNGAWLLLIELLRLMNNAEAHDEICINYSIAFEVSPPQFIAPAGVNASNANDFFIMPTLIISPVEAVLQALIKHASTQSTLIIDCSQLIRVEFTAVLPLLNGLSKLGENKTVELHNMNFLVAVLLKLIGGERNLSIFTRRL